MSDTRDTGNALLDAAIAYVTRELALTWMDYGSKGPTHAAWNTPAQVITTIEGARAQFGNGTLFNIGLVHSLGTVKTCSFDVDEVEHTRAIFEELGLSFDVILESSAPCVRGKVGRYRFEYRQPPGMDLPARKLEWPAKNGSASKFPVFELRAGPSQDVLPPSMHPDGHPYTWVNPLPESNDDWPTPPAALLELWQNWDAWAPLLQELCPWTTPPKPKPTPRPRGVKGLVDVIGQFNQAHSIRDILEAHGYRPKGRNRWLPPNSTSGIPSVRLLPGNDALVFSTNGSCPLNDDRAHDAFDCYRILAHGGDWKAARSEAAQLLGIELRPPRDRATGTGQDSSPPPGREPPPIDSYTDDPEARGQSRDKGAGGQQNNRNSRDSETRTEIDSVCFADIKAKRLNWEWYPLLLRRASNLVVGDSDVGKTKALTSMVAIVTTGGVYPGTAVAVPPRNVIMLCAEEDAETMIKPALLAAGADCSRVHLVRSCAEYDSRGRMKRRLVTLEHDIDSITTLAIKIGNVGMLSIDPVTAYLGTKISGNENSAIRSILGGLQSFAEAHDCANILLTHFNKSTSASAKSMVIGSIAFTAGVRSVIGAFRDPEDDTKVRRLLVPMKVNLVPESDRFGIAFEIHGKDVIEDGETLPNVGYTVWLPGRVTKTADEIIAAQQSKFAETRSDSNSIGAKRQRVIDVLRAAGRPLHAREITEILEGESIPSNSDKRRVKVRKLLREMLADGQVCQLETEEYTLPGAGGEHVDF